MPVFIDVGTRLDVKAAEAAAAKVKDLFTRASEDISKSFGGGLSRGFNAFDGSAVRNELRAIQDEFARTAAAESDAARMLVRSQSEVEASTRRLTELTAKYGETSSQVARQQGILADAQARSAVASNKHIDSMIAAEAAAKRMGSAQNDAAGAMSSAGRVFNAAGITAVAGLGVAMVETTRKAGDFQQQMIKLQASAGESQQNIKTVSDGILQMAGKVGYTASELSNGMYTIEKAGFRGADALKVLQAAAQGAGAEQADLSEVINGLTTSMTDFNVTPENAARLMSQMVTAVGSAKTNFQDFAGALHSVEPVAAAAHLKLEDVWGTLAQITQSGTSTEQATENMRNAINALTGQSQPARDAMAQFGISADDVSQKLSQRGLAGTMQYLSDTVRQRLMPDLRVSQGVLNENAQAQQSLDDMMTQMSPHAQELASALRNNQISVKEYTKAARDSTAEDRAKLQQFGELNNKLDGFSKATRTGRDDLETYNKAMRDMTGTVAGQSVALQVTNEHADETNQRIKDIAATTTDANGNVKGFSETQEGLNAKFRDARAAINASAIEMGDHFIPVMTQVAGAFQSTANFMAQHTGLVQGAITAVEGLAGAWAAWKALMVFDRVLTGIENVVNWTRGLTTASQEATTAAEATNAAMGSQRVAAAETGAAGVASATTQEVAEEGAVADAAAGADAAMAGGGAAGGAGRAGRWLRGAGAVLPAVGPAMALQDAAGNNADTLDPSKAGWGHVLFGSAWDMLNGHAAGGPINGNGPKGRDSVLMWGAPGEHVFTADEVDKAGGHGAMYALRSAIRGYAGGGAIYGGGAAPDVQVAESLVGTTYNQGNRNDCSGMVGQVINGALGMSGGLPTTQNMGQWLTQRGFRQGIGGPGTISVGWYNHGSAPNDGHAAMTLSDGENAESGGSHGNFLVGSGAAGASNSEFDHHMYLPLNAMYGEGQGDGGGGMPGMGGMGSMFGGMGGSGGGGGGIGGMGGGGLGSGGGYGGPWGSLVSILTQFLANLALGNPLGKMMTQGQQPGGYSPYGGGAPYGSVPIGQPQTVDQMRQQTLETDRSALAWDRVLTAQQKIATERHPQNMYRDQLMLSESMTRYNDTLIRNDQANDKAAASSDNLHQRLGDLNAQLKQQTDHLNEIQGKSTTKPSTIEAAQNAIHRTNEEIDRAQAKLTPIDTSWTQDFSGGGGLGPVFKRSGGASGGAGVPGQIGGSITSLNLAGSGAGSGLSSLTGRAGTGAVFQGSVGGHPLLSAQSGSGGGTGLLGLAGAAGSGVRGAPFTAFHGDVAGHNPLGVSGAGSAIAAGTGNLGGRDTRPALPGQLGQHPAAAPPGGGVAGAGSAITQGAQGAAAGGGGGQATLTDTSRQPGTENTGGKGFSPGGGMLGMAEGAGAMALNAIAPGAGEAAQIGMQEANRTIGFMGQLGAILGVEMPLETFGLNDTPLGDPTKSPIGRIGLGIAGAHPTGNNTAGKTAPPLAAKPDAAQGVGTAASGNGNGSNIGVNIENMHVNNGDGEAAARDINRNVNMYPSNTR